MIGIVQPAQAEADLAAGRLGCPECGGVLRRWGHGRARQVRDHGSMTLTVRPRRARCQDCGSTQVLLPCAVLPRRADTTAVIGTALLASARGVGYRRIAADFARPVSTVRRWVRSVRGQHTEWLRARGIAWLHQVDREVIATLKAAPTPLDEAPEHAAAEQAFVLIDVTATGDAVDLLDRVRRRADTTSPRVLRAWLAAAHGEALAAHGDRTASLYAFDHAAELLPSDLTDERPYVAFDTVHLARWRGHARARFGDPHATAILIDALNRLDPSFVRAETALHIDLATAHASNGDRDEARDHATHAARLAAQVGSARQRRRLASLQAAVH